MMTGILFVLGAAVGSFLNVIALRYDPEKFIITRRTVGGRSHCPHCRHILRWFELIPFLSFALQLGRCRNCGVRLSFQYPFAELVSGLIFVFVPQRLDQHFFLSDIEIREILVLKAVFVLAFLALMLMALIDWRLTLIPDEITVMIALLGGVFSYFAKPAFSLASGSFIGGYALLAGIRTDIFINHLAGAFAGAGFLYFLYLVSLKRGIGFGDVKLALALGFLFGWPDIMLILFFAFIAGSVYGLFAIASGSKTMKSFLAFGPFLALGAALVYFCGHEFVSAYFRLFEF